MSIKIKNNILYVIIILILLLIIVFISHIKANMKVKKLSKDYIEQRYLYDSLTKVYNQELVLLEEEVETLSNSIRNTKSLLRSLEVQNKLNSQERDRLEKEIARFNTIRNENSKKIYTPEQLDSRLITIFKN